MESINIEKIMEEIRAEIKEKGWANEILSFNDINVDKNNLSAINFNSYDFKDDVEMINQAWDVQAYRILRGNRGIISKISVLLKKVIRKLTKFYVEPIVEDQSDFNALTVKLFNLLSCYIDEQQKKEEEIKILIDEQKALKEEIEKLKSDTKARTA